MHSIHVFYSIVVVYERKISIKNFVAQLVSFSIFNKNIQEFKSTIELKIKMCKIFNLPNIWKVNKLFLSLYQN